MWILIILCSAIYFAFLFKIYKSLNSSREEIKRYNFDIHKFTKSRSHYIVDAIEILHANNIDVNEFEELNDDLRFMKLKEYEEQYKYLKEDTRYQHAINSAKNVNTRAQDKKNHLARLAFNFNDRLEIFPASYFAAYLEFEREVVDNNRKSKKKKPKKRLEFIRNAFNDKVALFVKIGIDIASVDFALISIYYCFKKNIIFGLAGLLVFGIGSYLVFFKKKKSKFPIWVFSVIAGVVCITGFMMPKKAVDPAGDTPPIKLDINHPYIDKDSPYAISQVLDIQNTTINTLNKYAWTDLENGFLASTGNTINNKMDYMLEVITRNNVSLSQFYSSNNNPREFTKKNISLNSITLCTPKNQVNSTGLIKLNYKLDIGFTWQDNEGKKKSILTPAYVSYVWNINLNNKDNPVYDPSSFIFKYADADTDYTSWHTKNVDSAKVNFDVDERIMHK